MKYSYKRIKFAFILQIILIHFHSSSCFYPTTKSYEQIENLTKRSFLRKHTFCKETECINYRLPPAGKEPFYRDTKAGDFSRMLAIDLSQLHPRSSEVPTASTLKPPVNLLGVDVSVLSQNPAPNSPIAQPTFDITPDGRIIHENNFDPRFNRLPNLENYPMRDYLPQVFTTARSPLLYPFQYLPLDIMAIYNFVAKSKQRDGDLQAHNNQKQNDDEKKFTANFIFNLLRRISSSHQEDYNF